MIKIVAVLMVLLVSLTVNSAYGYHVYEHPNLYVEVDWIYEPVIATERNGVEIMVKDISSGEPISGLEDQLTAELSFEGEKMNLSLTEDHANPGRYTSWLIPMFKGDYTIVVSGAISNIPITNEFRLSTVEDIVYERFPETSGLSKFVTESEEQDESILLQEVKQLKTKISEMESPPTQIIYAAIGIAIVGLVIGAIALFRRK